MSTKESANIVSIRKQISIKNGYNPYYATVNDTKSVITDMDHFPYTRFFTGIPTSSEPVVFKREAGWNSNFSNSSPNESTKENIYPNHCFQGSCSTTYPCKPNK
jgi:hypothetical protein